jgi:hypothetical protein
VKYYLCRIQKGDIERKKNEVKAKLRNGELIAKAEPPVSLHGSFRE